jgi:probable phosphoglycerate mutase
LIRHGQTEWNVEERLQGWLDSALTPEAITQLESMHIPKLNNPVLLSSDLGRAILSAKVISQRLKLDIKVDARLKERGFGILEGETVDQGDHLIGYWNDYHQRYARLLSTEYGAEPERILELRLRRFLADVQQFHADCDVIIVSHGECLRALSNIIRGIPSWHRGEGVIQNGVAKLLEVSANENEINPC